MGADIIIPLIVLAIVVPAAFWWARSRLKGTPGADVDTPPPPTNRLTSNALRELANPPWRVVYEIAEAKLGGIGHVLIGPPGVFAIQTRMDSIPEPTSGDPDPQIVATSAIARGALDDGLRRCAMESDRLVVVHWGRTESGPHSIDVVPRHTAVDGHRFAEWIATLDREALTPAQVDQAWQTVLTSIGRPDPLA